MTRPKEIHWFVITQLLSLAYGLYQIFTDWDQLVASVPELPSSAMSIIVLISYGINLLLIYLIGWRRSNVARWIYIVLATIGLASLIAGFFDPNIAGGMIKPLLQFALGAVGIVLLLMPKVSTWFSRDLDPDPDTFN